MKKLKLLKDLMRDARGVATSLIEATATVAVGAVLAGVAVGGAIDAINDSKIQAAIGDVSSIGQGVITFYKDNSFFPLFKNGQMTGSSDPAFDDLVSENGTYPTDVSPTMRWEIPTSPPTWSDGIHFGNMPDYNLHDSIEGQLMYNVLGHLSTATYPLRGTYAGDPERGWAGPYVAVLPKTDPWGNKYMINVRDLNAGYLLANSSLLGGGPGNLPQIAVIVLSAGPNRVIETNQEQSYNTFAPAGDDIIYRIK